ncbi:SET domain-containing protein [Madurella fahalii]|uniref:SET domain-containing protein n=1 Tax=Madurella fahalii TaxID=1157608 RepID=A0ABQ0GHZ8_9PEZI
MAPERARRLKMLGHTTLLPLLTQALLAQASLNECPVSVPITLNSAASNVACPLPVDDISEVWLPGASPWTHPPECVYTAGKAAKYCAYTNSRHGSRGWSIITSPETAADNIGFLNMPLNSSRRTGLRDAPYKIVDIPGKGKGLVATRRIKRYQEILVDYATVLVDIAFTTKVPAFQGYRLLHSAVNQLSDPDSVLELDGSSEFAQDRVENVLRTNSFHTNLGGVPHMAVYPAVSRINHACMPNAYTRFMPEKLQVSVAAAKDIEEGEEITISYLTLGQPSEERKKNIKQWGFECTCSLCTASKAEIEASDARRRQIETLREYAIRAFQAGRPYQALRFTRQIINLLPSEELFPMFSEQYENMARIFYVLRDKKNAEKYATMSLEILAEQGYIESVRPEHLEQLWKRFEQEEGGRY